MSKLSYLGIPSPLQRLSAISKFSELFAVAFLGYFITNPLYQLILFLVLSLVILFLGKIPMKDYIKGLSLFLTFGLILFIMQSLLYAGTNQELLFSLGFLKVKKVGIYYGLNLMLRVFVLGSSVLSFIMTTEPRRMIYDMVERLHIPYRFAYGFYSALRFIPIFEGEIRNIMNAHAIRGTSTVEKGFVAKAKMFVTLAAPLLVSGLRKAKNTAIAMEARAFGAYTKRTQTKEYRETAAGIVFMILPWCITIGYFVMLVVTHNLGFLNT